MKPQYSNDIIRVLRFQTPTFPSNSDVKILMTFDQDIATIYFYSILFKETFKPALPDFTPMDLESEIKKDSELISNLIVALLHCFPNPSKKKIKYQRLTSNLNWPYLLRRVIDRHLDSFPQPINPMVVSPTQEISMIPSEHPFFSLPWETRLSILYSLVQWSLSDYQPIRDKIDAEMKARGRSSSHCVSFINKVLKPAGVDRTNNKMWHYGPTSRVYIQDSNGDWSILCTTLEELQRYVSTLYPVGHEWALKTYLTKIIPQVEAEIERKNQERIAEEERLLKLAREEALRLQKELEKEQMRLLGPRRSKRTKNEKSYTIDDDDSDFTEFEESSSSEEEEVPVEPERRSERIAQVLVQDEEDTVDTADPLTA